MEYVEFILQGVDMQSGTYITWESATCEPKFKQISRTVVAAIAQEIKEAAPGYDPVFESRQKPHSPRQLHIEDDNTDDLVMVAGLTPSEVDIIKASTTRCLVNPTENARFMQRVAWELKLEEFISDVTRETRQAQKDGKQLLLIVNPPPSLGQLPWELLPVTVLDDPNQDPHIDDQVLLDVTGLHIITMGPMLVRDSDPNSVHPHWHPGEGLYLIQPWEPSQQHKPVLDSYGKGRWREKLRDLTDSRLNRAFTPTTRVELAKILQEHHLQPGTRPEDAAPDAPKPITRFLYVGHVSGENETAGMLLNDTAEVFGLLPVDSSGLRWFGAVDITQDTSRWREVIIERKRAADEQTDHDEHNVAHATQFPPGAPVIEPQAESHDSDTYDPLRAALPAFADITMIDADNPVPGTSIWPMPPRVGLIACHSGSESSSSEPFGLTTACLEAGAELVFATRWTMYTDAAYSILSNDEDPPTPFLNLSLKVDEFLKAEDPIHQMTDWKKDCLNEWRKDPYNAALSPIAWVALTVFRAPDRKIRS